jgi:hypothetical protein
MDNQLRIAFYSCMIGSSNNPRCLFPELPSRDFPCFMYSNNSEYLSQLKQKSSKWNCILVNHGIPIDDHVQCAYSAKYYKACPYALTELKDFQYTCYFDTTLIVDEQKVLRYVREILPYSNYKWITTNHPFLLPCVWNEYREAMLQERYSRDSSRYREYIKEFIMLLDFIFERIVKKYERFVKNGTRKYKNVESNAKLVFSLSLKNGMELLVHIISHY